MNQLTDFSESFQKSEIKNLTSKNTVKLKVQGSNVAREWKTYILLLHLI